MRASRIAAVDYGQKRVGIAISDPLRLFAQPYGAYSPDQALEVLKSLQALDGLDVIVAGWPLTIEGEEGEMTIAVQQFINRMQKVLPGVDVVKWDERYTSEVAKEAIRSAGAKRKARRDKGRIDAAAASIILQEYLDR